MNQNHQIGVRKTDTYFTFTSSLLGKQRGALDYRIKDRLNKLFPAIQKAEFSSGCAGLLSLDLFSESFTHPEIGFVAQKTPRDFFCTKNQKMPPPPPGRFILGGGRLFGKLRYAQGAIYGGSAVLLV